MIGRWTPTLLAILMMSGKVSAEGEPVGLSREALLQVRSILSDKCFHCHGPDANHRQADLRLDVKESAFADRDGAPAIRPGRPDESTLIERIESTDPDLTMPPADSGRRLSDADRRLLREWVAGGATWTEHWSFAAPVRPSVPLAQGNAWAQNPIDSFVADRLARSGLSPSAEAGPTTLLRRLSLDLTGMPPTLAELDDFAEHEPDDAVERVTDRLLASVRFGEHWALAWLDAARYADTNGYQNDGTRTMWHWRDWVVDAFNRNLPFDRFTQMQVAGDLLPSASQEDRLATGFHRNHMLNGEGGRIAEESRVEYCLDRVDTTATVWLGLTMGCARCHDHKYDPFTQQDFYRLYAYFNSVDEVGGVDRGGNALPTIKLPTEQQQRMEQELNDQIASLEEELARPVDTSEAALVHWESDVQEKVRQNAWTARWIPLVPEEYASSAGATMQRMDDLSVLVTGNNPEQDVYRVSGTSVAGMATGLLLEALPHADFTKGGLARSNSGNFVLTELAVRCYPPDHAEPIEVEIASAEADFAQPGLPVEHSIDGKRETGWAVLSDDIQQPRKAVFRFAHAVPLAEGSRLEIVLHHESAHKHHNLGRFRLSVTTDETPALPEIRDWSDPLLWVLATPEDHRSDIQRALLTDSFVQAVSKREELQRTLDQRKGDRNRLLNSMAESMVLADRAEPRETYVLIRGAYDQPDKSKLLEPAIPEALGSLPTDGPKDRRSLADWLIDKANPLTARVAVNGWWQQLWGHGLVRTPEDFGSQGELPTHPDLLDWLAVELRDGGWDRKAMIRLIVTSAAYRQSSEVTLELLERDPENRLLSRGARFRLSSLALRDQALSVSGLYVDAVGGPGVNPYQPADIWTDFSLGKIQYKQDEGANLYRRSIYTFWRRSVGPSLFFDTPTRQTCSVRPRLTNTPLHALGLLNDPTYVEAARALAARILLEADGGVDERLRDAFRLVTARMPSPEELEVLRGTLARSVARFSAKPVDGDALLEVGDSPVPAGLDRAELAAYAATMNVLLNLDEVLTKE